MRMRAHTRPDRGAAESFANTSLSFSITSVISLHLFYFLLQILFLKSSHTISSAMTGSFPKTKWATIWKTCTVGWVNCVLNHWVLAGFTLESQFYTGHYTAAQYGVRFIF